MLTASIGTYRTGSQLYDGATPVRLNIVNDTIAVTWEQRQVISDVSIYKYSNANFPTFFGLDTPDNERYCKIPDCNNYREFWYKYFWILKNKMGTPATGIQIDCPPDGCPSQNPSYYAKIDDFKSTQMNGLRLGPHNEYAMEFQVICFRDHRAYCDQVMKNIFDMAELNNCYVVWTMGGGSGEAECAGMFGTGSLFVISADTASAYKGFIKYCYDFINVYGNRKALAMFDVHNEPNTESMLYGYAYDNTHSASWGLAACNNATPPFTITSSSGVFPDMSVGGLISINTSSSPPTVYRITSVVRDGNGNITQVISNIAPVVGTHVPFSGKTFYRWNGWWVNKYPLYVYNGTTYYLKDAAEISYKDWAEHLLQEIKAGITLNPKPLLTIGEGSAQGDIPSLDVLNGHPYGGAEDNAGNKWTVAAVNAMQLGKPMFWEEYGYNRTNHSPWNSYWPFFDMMCAYEGHSAGAMQFNGSFNTPDWDYAYDQMQYPGYTYHNGDEDGYCPGDCFMTQAEIDAFFADVPSLPTQMMIAIGTELYDGETKVFLCGVNDTIVMNWAQANQPPASYTDYLYSNHNFPNYIAVGEVFGDSEKLNKIPNCSSYREFFWKYFWIVKNKLGGIIPGYSPLTTALNHVRFGPHNIYARQFQVDCFYNKRVYCDQLMNGIFEMANYNDLYVTYMIGGCAPGEDSWVSNDPDFGTGSAFETDTTAYAGYVDYCIDFINAYKDNRRLVLFDLWNEPMVGSPTAGIMGYYWVPTYGTASTYAGTWTIDGIVTDVYRPAYEVACLEWKNQLITDVKAGITGNMPLITVGEAAPYTIYTLPDAQLRAAKAWAYLFSEYCDVIIWHPYNGAESDEDNFKWRYYDINMIGKPGYYEEFGYNANTLPKEPYISYSPFFDKTLRKYTIPNAWMQLNGMPNSDTPGDYKKPPYPGMPGEVYTITQAQIDAFFAGIPPVPGITVRKMSPTGSAYGGVHFY